MKTKRTPVHPAKSSHVGPVGRKMWAELPRIFTVIPQVFHNEKPLTVEPMPVLVISLDPANVERIREEVRQCINWWFDGEGDFGMCLTQSTEDILAALGLTPAKRKGRKAQ